MRVHLFKRLGDAEVISISNQPRRVDHSLAPGKYAGNVGARPLNRRWSFCRRWLTRRGIIIGLSRRAPGILTPGGQVLLNFNTGQQSRALLLRVLVSGITRRPCDLAAIGEQVVGELFALPRHGFSPVKLLT